MGPYKCTAKENHFFQNSTVKRKYRKEDIKIADDKVKALQRYKVMRL